MTRHTHGRRLVDQSTGRSPSLHRVEQYRDPLHASNWDGRSTESAISRWSDRATRNSQLAPRAIGTRENNGSTERDLDLPAVHSSGRKMDLHSTSAPPKRDEAVDAKVSGGGKAAYSSPFAR
jgi:hypothetical protein